jgi:predicted RNA-binding Zn-ribbon protein involved in translation (DUF1610 family)
LAQPDGASRKSGKESSGIAPAPIKMSDDQQHWNRYKFWRNLALLVLAGFFPVILLARVIARIVNLPVLFIIIAFAWFLLIGTAGTAVSYWQCPRCGKPFSRTSGYRMVVYARRCVHCGLPSYSNS